MKALTRKLLLVVGGGTAIALVVVVSSSLFQASASVMAPPPAVEDVLASVVEARLTSRAAETIAVGNVPYGGSDEIHILTLGIDSRKEGRERHCDAIHMVSINVKDWTATITSVPRGTYTYIPPGNYEPTEYYVANACAYAGLDYGVEQIERIVGVQADYVATVGFSQALGIFRVLQLPTTETLQWLRHRHTYQIGDPQRSQNQAVFLKDMATKVTGGEGLSTPVLYVLYSLLDTDMDFGTVKALYQGFKDSDIADHPERVTLTMKPYYETQEYHLDFENPSAQVSSLLDALEGRLSDQDLSNNSIAEVQAELVTYLHESLANPALVEQIFEEQSWRQVEDESDRETLHYGYMEAHAMYVAKTNTEAAIQVVADYILEKQTLGLTEWEGKGRTLMATFVE